MKRVLKNKVNSSKDMPPEQDNSNQILFQHSDFRSYLLEVLSQRGLRAQLAEHLDMTTSHLSLLLKPNSKLQLKDDHCFLISKFFNHNEEATEYFQLLVQLSRSRLPEARKLLNKRIDDLRNRANAHFQTYKVVGDLDNSEFVDPNLFSLATAVVHTSLQIPGVKTFEGLKKVTNYSATILQQALQTLVASKQVREENGDYYPNHELVFFAKNSNGAHRYSQELRLAALQNANRGIVNESSYLAVVLGDEEKLNEIRQQLRDVIKNINTYPDKPTSRPHIFIIDLFKCTGLF